MQEPRPEFEILLVVCVFAFLLLVVVTAWEQWTRATAPTLQDVLQRPAAAVHD